METMELNEVLRNRHNNVCPWCNSVTVVSQDKCNKVDCVFYDMLQATTKVKTEER